MKQFDVMMAHGNIQMSNVTWVSTWQEQLAESWTMLPPIFLIGYTEVKGPAQGMRK